MALWFGEEEGETGGGERQGGEAADAADAGDGTRGEVADEAIEAPVVVDSSAYPRGLNGDFTQSGLTAEQLLEKYAGQGGGGGGKFEGEERDIANNGGLRRETPPPPQPPPPPTPRSNPLTLQSLPTPPFGSRANLRDVGQPRAASGLRGCGCGGWNRADVRGAEPCRVCSRH